MTLAPATLRAVNASANESARVHAQEELQVIVAPAVIAVQPAPIVERQTQGAAAASQQIAAETTEHRSAMLMQLLLSSLVDPHSMVAERGVCCC